MEFARGEFLGLSALQGAARQVPVDSPGMRCDIPDAVPTARSNVILWNAIRGWNAHYAERRRVVFASLGADAEDDDRH